MRREYSDDVHSDEVRREDSDDVHSDDVVDMCKRSDTRVRVRLACT